MSNHRWPQGVLALAAIYNLAWGTWVVGWPDAMLAVMGMEPINHRPLLQCLGMVIGVYGIGYAIAATAPLRHWPLVLVGLIGKVLGPLGFVVAATRGELPWSFGWTLIFNDLLWWAPFSMILYQAFRAHSCPQCPTVSLSEALRSVHSQRGATLDQLSHRRPTLVLFLRHAGCIFCREALGDLASRRAEVEQAGVELAVVHMSSPMGGTRLLSQYGMEDVHRFSDPDCGLYRAFQLPRGCFLQLFSPRILWRGTIAFFRGHGFGPLQGDGFQMPGVFLLDRGEIIGEYRHVTAADRPDYVQFMRDTLSRVGESAARSFATISSA